MTLQGCSKKLGYKNKVCLLEVFKAWEGLVEILCKVENSLGGLNYLVLTSSGYGDHPNHCVWGDELGLS